MESRCLIDICARCHQWLCADCLPICICEEIEENYEESYERIEEAREAEHIEGTEGTEEVCQVHCGMY